MLTPNELQLVLWRANMAPNRGMAEEGGPVCRLCIGRLINGNPNQDGIKCDNCSRAWNNGQLLGKYWIRCKNCFAPYPYLEGQNHFCDELVEPEPVRRREAVLATRRKVNVR